MLEKKRASLTSSNISVGAQRLILTESSVFLWLFGTCAQVALFTAANTVYQTQQRR